MDPKDTVWQGEDLTLRYLTGVRGAIPLAQVQLDAMLRLIQWERPLVTAVLDLGCGDGILGQAVLDAYTQANGVFIDFSAPMLAAAKKRLAVYSSRVSLVNGDYGQPGWQSSLDVQQFDVIVSGYSIHHQPDTRKRALYAELFDMLTPGGIFLNVEHVASHSTWGREIFDHAFIDAMVAYHQQIGSDQSPEQIAYDFYHRPDKAANILLDVETQCSWLREIGFVNVDCYLKYFELATFGGLKSVQ